MSRDSLSAQSITHRILGLVTRVCVSQDAGKGPDRPGGLSHWPRNLMIPVVGQASSPVSSSSSGFFPQPGPWRSAACHQHLLLTYAVASAQFGNGVGQLPAVLHVERNPFALEKD